MSNKMIYEELPFVDGLFSPSEASEMLYDIISRTMNFCTIKQWSEWEKNNSADLSHYDNMKADFDSRRTKIREELKKLCTDDQKLRIELVLNVKVDSK